MAIYSKLRLEEQQETIAVVRTLTAVTVIRLGHTQEVLLATNKVLKKIDDSLRRVFEIYPGSVTKRKINFLIAKPLLIFLSANQELYGELINNVADAFLKDAISLDADVLIIGKVGKLLMEKQHLSNKIIYLELNDDHPELEKMKLIFAEVAKYQKIVIYHGKNESLLRQSATRSEIAREIPKTIIKPARKYFFEPSPDEVLEYLQDRIAVNGVYQKLYEGQVAKLSARRWNWTKQQLARQKLINQLLKEYGKYRKVKFQKQQQVTLSAQRMNEGEIIGIT